MYIPHTIRDDLCTYLIHTKYIKCMPCILVLHTFAMIIPHIVLDFVTNGTELWENSQPRQRNKPLIHAHACNDIRPGFQGIAWLQYTYNISPGVNFSSTN